jgi:mRNA interferase MazF
VSGTRPATVRRGEIWLVNLDPTIGGEIQKTRPCLVISPPEMNAHLRTIVMAPLTTGGRPAPFRVPIRFGGKDGLILLDQMRTLDRQRLVRRLGTADAAALRTTLARLRDLFAE